MAIRGIPPSSRWFFHTRDRHTVTELRKPIYTKPILLKLGFQAVTTTIPYVWTPAPWHDGPRGSRIPIVIWHAGPQLWRLVARLPANAVGELDDVGDCVIEGGVGAVGSGHWCGCVDCPHGCARGPSDGNAGRRVFDDQAPSWIDTHR